MMLSTELSQMWPNTQAFVLLPNKHAYRVVKVSIDMKTVTYVTKNDRHF